MRAAERGQSRAAFSAASLSVHHVYPQGNVPRTLRRMSHAPSVPRSHTLTPSRSPTRASTRRHRRRRRQRRARPTGRCTLPAPVRSPRPDAHSIVNVAAGVAGLGAYVYLDRSGKAEVKPKKVQEKSPLDPDNFVDFKLKKIEPYNHNTAKYANSMSSSTLSTQLA